MAFNPLLSIFSNHFISFSTRRRFGAHQAKKKKKKKKKTGGDGGMKRSASELVLEALFHHHGDDRSSPSLSLEELLLPAAMGFGWPDGMAGPDLVSESDGQTHTDGITVADFCWDTNFMS
ncbi:uncharacterized protein LOC122043129 isoform X2 [Zingiber officinale]|uniref:uncharacterized protein LOC122043129 isoform X2 n=1 Tax=Zingiber officinale TaxID=94328 RepID=UPI001C4D89B5|nr:uncharacterized protein LOC122043129 isoform X2 [Zingiber officinale]